MSSRRAATPENGTLRDNREAAAPLLQRAIPFGIGTGLAADTLYRSII
jgi:hypothetical protein